MSSEKIGKVFLLLLLPFLCFCVQKKTESTQLNNYFWGITEDEKENQLQDEKSASTSIFSLSVDTDYIFLKGSQINRYIDENREEQVHCLVLPYEQDASGQVLIIAAKPQSSTDPNNNLKEYYYLLSPGLEDDNRSHCDTADLAAALYNIHPGKALIYVHKNICPNCTSSPITSEYISLFNRAGNRISETDINLSVLKVKLNLTPSPPESVLSCTHSDQCQSSGYDCCNQGQCIKDGIAKSGADQLPGFVDARQKVQNNSSLVSDYPQYFQTCGRIIQNERDESFFNADTDAFRRFEYRREIYECLTPQEGESSLCTISYLNATTSPTRFITGIDDRNFIDIYSGTGTIPSHGIVEIIHDREVLYGNGAGEELIGVGNDTLTDPTVITLPANRRASYDDTLKIRYRIDGSCKIINSNLAYCSKYYIQGQNNGEIDDHYPASSTFNLPYYADIDRPMKVSIDGVDKINSVDWRLVESFPSYVEFTDPRMPIHDNQEVILSFFVDTTLHPVMDSLTRAMEKLDLLCKCGGEPCSLKPIYSANGNQQTITDFSCHHPREIPETPEVVYLSSKTVPVRFFDESGRYHKDIDIDTPKQEGDLFQYMQNNHLRPNNVNDYIGFNEVYGSFSIFPSSAIPAKEVPVKRGQYYNIFVNEGNFSSCVYCGTDYYSPLARIFPHNFTNKAGGYTPNDEHNNPMKANPYRAHDLIFGRACFVPVTMIPWTHTPDSDLGGQQRLNRQRAQHFLFANGYQRDWYGFDYGSLIGSFDGVSWFSIGNQRQIRALGNKLFLAFNTYFGDLSEDHTYSVHITEGTFNPIVDEEVKRDFDSDGAMCQKYHQCKTDDDCASNLGWEYTCENIKNIRTKWPLFDTNAVEQINTEREDRLVGIINYGFGGTSKRCVYRGKGAPCHIRMNVAARQSYAGVQENGIHACSMNNYCQSFIDGTLQQKFNDRIRRFAESVANQNASSLVPYSDADLFGMTAPIIGRPYDYNGDKIVNASVQSVLSNNRISSLCIPGRDPSANVNLLQQNAFQPDRAFFGDPVNSLGMTMEGAAFNDQYLSSCSIFDEGGNYYHLDKAKPRVNFPELLSDRVGSPPTTSIGIVQHAGAQAISTNSLGIFESLLSGESLISNFKAEQIDEISLQESRCLRAPGSRCHTDMDCAPSQYIANKLASIDPESTDNNGNPFDGTNALNKYEIYFWKEYMVCKQKEDRDEPFILESYCCREEGKDLTVASLEIPTPPPPTPSISFENQDLPAIDTPLNEFTRYNRMNLLYDKNSSRFPALSSSSPDPATPNNISILENQFASLNEILNNTCCSGHWIRNFNRDNNGGGHKWAPLRLQSFNANSFRCLNWEPCGPAPTGSPSRNNPPACAADLGYGEGFHCGGLTEDPADAICSIRSPLPRESNALFEQLGRMELLGIPQTSIQASTFPAFTNINNINNLSPGTFSPFTCRVDPENQNIDAIRDMDSDSIVDELSILPFLTKDISVEAAEYNATGSAADTHPQFYSATDLNNFIAPADDGDMKLVFSADKFTCCLPAATRMQPGDDPDLCCTGFIDPRDNFCKLPDYTNLSVYTNRYVSSHAKDIPITQVNPATGYLSQNQVEEMACNEGLCASRTLAYGIALADLRVPGHENNRYTVRRYVDGYERDTRGEGLARSFRAGLRWNTHVYCIPQGLGDILRDEGFTVRTGCN